MNSDYDLDDESYPSKKELAGARKDAEEYLHLWQRRALYATVAFFVCCAAVVPFSKGESLHAYAEPFGRILVYLAMVLFIPFVICVGIAVNSWLFLWKLKKGQVARP